MMVDLSTTKKILEQNLPHLKEVYHLKRVGVFGSIARGDASQESDVDILIELVQPISLFKLIELEDQLTTLLNRNVDVVTVSALKPLIKDTILRETVYV